MDSYINKMQEKENLCLAYMQKADDVSAANGYAPSKEECVYLQKAATLRYEMAQMSVGEERLYQQRKVQELNQRIKNIVRLINPEKYREVQEGEAEARKKKAAAESLYSASKKAIDGREKPVLEELEAAKMSAERRADEALKELEEIRGYYRENTRVYQALEPVMEKRGRIMEKHRKLDDLYNLLGGKVSGGRMDIETFVQRYYLERILYAANRRFQEMSAGQFELRMKDIDKAGVGKNRGLDLMVYSTVTGKEREVRTLSGGESFMAALSLALGMADQIQESAASVNLDIMFIDEGFGSLDDHSRDKAVRVLQDMANGSKMIGIISHVTELKQEIEDQLIVTKDEDGSHVRWQIS